MFTGSVPTAGRFRVLADVGLKLVSEGKIEFDETKFRQAYAADPQAVEKLFSDSESLTEGTPPKTTIKGLGIGWLMETSFTRLIDPVDGVITRENKTLDQKTQGFQDRIDNLDKLLAQKRTRLERQFADLESVLANLQSQQTALNSFQPVQPSSGGR
jgi:flagellar hook-associated protein 2